MAGQLAFPTALGSGAYVSGGRGQSVYHVTNLNNSGAGSLRDALSASNRTIVFDVSGVCSLTGSLNCTNKSNITIAFQTAPEGGFTVDGDRVYFENVKNLVVRYARFKGGVDSKSFEGGGTNSFQAKGAVYQQIFDHCTFAFGFFQGGSWYESGIGVVNGEFTVQRCFFANNDRGVLSGQESGSAGTTSHFSFISNLFYNQTHRTPNVAGDGTRVDVINNVTWFALNRLMQPAGSLQLNHIGNYYDYNRTKVNNYKLNMYGSRVGTPPSIYTNRNKYVAIDGTESPSSKTLVQINADNKLGFRYFTGVNYGNELPPDYFRETPFAMSGKAFTPLSADEAFEDVKNDVGCNARLNADGSVSDNLDVLDTQWLNNVKNNIRISGLQKPTMDTWNVPAITSVSRPVGFYGTNQHIPQAYLSAKGLANTTTIHNDIGESGYTYLEEYLNQVDVKVLPENTPIITRTDSNPTTIVQGGIYIPPTGIWTDEVDGSGAATVTGTVNTTVAGTYTVTLEWTNTNESRGFLDIIYTVVLESGNIIHPLTEEERNIGKRRVVKMIKQRTL